MNLEIGTVVRAPRPNNTGTKGTFAGKATLATIEYDGDSNNESARNEREHEKALLIFDDIHPRPIESSIPFTLVPNIRSKTNISTEVLVSTSCIRPLFPFETKRNETDRGQVPKGNKHGSGEKENDSPQKTQSYKERGDTLFQCGDITCASSWYEYSLSSISPTDSVSIGSTIILREDKGTHPNGGTGRAIRAEVDCIDEHDDEEKCRMDVTLVPSGIERCISMKQVEFVLCTSISDGSSGVWMQTRILLNLTRCLLRLADFITTTSTMHRVEIEHSNNDSEKCQTSPSSANNNQHHQRYVLASIRASTFAIVCAEHLEEEENEQKDVEDAHLLKARARILRAKAYLALKPLKPKHARADIRMVLDFTTIPEGMEKKIQNQKQRQQLVKEVKVLMRSMDKMEQHAKKVNRKLAKEMCAWVNDVTDGNDNVSENAVVEVTHNGGEDILSQSTTQNSTFSSSSANPSPNTLSYSSPPTSLIGTFYSFIVMIPIIAASIQWFVKYYNNSSNTREFFDSQNEL